jgi:hypothetical protein
MIPINFPQFRNQITGLKSFHEKAGECQTFSLMFWFLLLYFSLQFVHGRR